MELVDRKSFNLAAKAWDETAMSLYQFTEEYEKAKLSTVKKNPLPELPLLPNHYLATGDARKVPCTQNIVSDINQLIDCITALYKRTEA